jgi:hypothetical protein
MAPHSVKKRKLSHNEESQQTESSSEDGEHRITSQASGFQESSRVMKQSTLKVKKDVEKSRLASFMSGNTQRLQSTDLFQLQIQELLAEVQPSYGSRMRSIEGTLEWLKNVIELIPEREGTSVSQKRQCQYF